MRKLNITLAIVLFALAVLALAPDAALTPYANAAHAVLPKAIAMGALLLLLAILAAVGSSNPREPPPKRSPPPAPPKQTQSDAKVVNFLAILQEKGRLVDFLMGDIAGYSDAQVGAAGRVLHEGCKAALMEHFGIRPMREESEGSKVTVPTEHAPDQYRLVGRITANRRLGTLIHHGWRVEWVKLPRLVRTSGDRPPAIAPAEVELG